MLHKDIILGDRHAAHNWEYADAAARTGASGFASGDVGKLALQTDDNTLWILTSTTPTWAGIAGDITGLQELLVSGVNIKMGPRSTCGAGVVMAILANFLIGLDQTVNCVVKLSDGWGWPDEMLSARAWRLRSKHPALRIWIDRLFFWDADHCQECYVIEYERKQLPDGYQTEGRN